MPNRAFHNKVNRAILGKNYAWVNKLMDAPSQSMGKKHRKVLHGPLDALIVSAVSKDSKAGAAVLLHSLTDQMSSAFNDVLSKKPKSDKYFKLKKH